MSKTQCFKRAMLVLILVTTLAGVRSQPGPASRIHQSRQAHQRHKCRDGGANSPIPLGADCQFRRNYPCHSNFDNNLRSNTPRS